MIRTKVLKCSRLVMSLKKEVGEVCFVLWNSRQLLVQAAQAETRCLSPHIIVSLFSSTQCSNFLSFTQHRKAKPQLNTSCVFFLKKKKIAGTTSKLVAKHERSQQNPQERRERMPCMSISSHVTFFLSTRDATSQIWQGPTGILLTLYKVLLDNT